MWAEAGWIQSPFLIGVHRLNCRLRCATITSIMRAFALALLLAPVAFAAGKTEILWDQYGVPHIFASTREEMFHAHGWAQMRNQASLLLRLYGESRGRAAEYWGPANLEL